MIPQSLKQLKFAPGQIEEIMTKTFVKSANIRSLLLKDFCPEAIANCRRIFTKFISPDIRNGTLIDINSFLSDPENDPAPEPRTFTKVALSETTFRALRLRFPNTIPVIRRTITFHTFEGRTFTTCSRHEGNSGVLVRSGLDSSLKPARIQDILEISPKEILYVIRHYRRVEGGISDPFAKYPFLHISLWSSMLGNCAIIRPEEVASHFASIPFSSIDEDDSLAVISLYRVSTITITYILCVNNHS